MHIQWILNSLELHKLKKSENFKYESQELNQEGFKFKSVITANNFSCCLTAKSRCVAETSL